MMDELKQQFYEVMHKYQKPFSEEGVTANLTQWSEQKQGLLQLLRRHPIWNEKELAIVFRVEERREIDRITVDETRAAILELGRRACTDDTVYENFETALRAATADYARIPNEYRLDTIRQYGGIKCAPGQKASRIINRLCLKFHLDQIEEEAEAGEPDNRYMRTVKPYNALFARLADALNPAHIEKTAVLSIHPCDFLEMSNRDNTWSSCHCLERGSYHGGCQSYMGDAVSMIFFTVSDEYTQDFHTAPRITREIFCYKDNAQTFNKAEKSGKGHIAKGVNVVKQLSEKVAAFGELFDFGKIKKIAKSANMLLSIDVYDFLPIEKEVYCIVAGEEQPVKKKLVLVFDDFERCKIGVIDLLGIINTYDGKLTTDDYVALLGRLDDFRKIGVPIQCDVDDARMIQGFHNRKAKIIKGDICEERGHRRLMRDEEETRLTPQEQTLNKEIEKFQDQWPYLMNEIFFMDYLKNPTYEKGLAAKSIVLVCFDDELLTAFLSAYKEANISEQQEMLTTLKEISFRGGVVERDETDIETTRKNFEKLENALHSEAEHANDAVKKFYANRHLEVVKQIRQKL